MDESAESLRTCCAVRIGDLHRTIERWSAGTSPHTPEGFPEFLDAQTDDFTSVTPDPTAPHGLRSRHLRETWIPRG
jgi:hypothetical protein